MHRIYDLEDKQVKSALAKKARKFKRAFPSQSIVFHSRRGSILRPLSSGGASCPKKARCTNFWDSLSACAPKISARCRLLSAEHYSAACTKNRYTVYCPIFSGQGDPNISAQVKACQDMLFHSFSVVFLNKNILQLFLRNKYFILPIFKLKISAFKC